ncbi:MAG: SpoIID/LytB domain-containing protein [Flavobacteriales bacterium]
MRWALLAFSIFCFHSVQAEVIKVGIFHHLHVNSVSVSVIDGTYELFKNDRLVHTYKAGEKLRFTYNSGGVLLNSVNYSGSASTKFELIAKTSSCELKASPKGNSVTRKLTGHLSFWNRGRAMSIINTLDLDVYITGVVEAESGSKQNEEYYKVQAVICRTYALSNKFKHAKSGFHLCDEVHCQVYKGISESNPDIISATMKTSDVVVVDEDINLITAAFHSNCGGHTINSEDVWSQAVPYLKAVPDTFCVDMPHSTWERSVKQVNFMGFLKKQGVSAHLDSMALFTPDTRVTHYQEKLHIKDIRAKFNLWSTLFSVNRQDDTFLISGKGFGHGVGLCQEGAMKMSQLGYSYISILHHYFTDIHVVPLSNFHLFQEN